MKYCSKCKKLLIENEFYKDKRAKSGLYSACKKCHYNKENYLENIKRWQKKNKKKVLRYQREYYKKNKEKLNKNHSKRDKKRRKIDVKFRLDKNISWYIRTSLRGNKAGRSWQKLVGYTLEDLTKHLEKQFNDKMNWNNYGSYWHIDHIKPQSLFNYIIPKDPEFKECWALTNLQPLEKIANIKKSNKY